MNGLLRFALTLANMPEKTVDDLDKSLPGFGRLAKLAQDAEPIIKRCAPHIEAIKPHIDAMKPDLIQLWALIEKAWPDFESVLPTVDELITYAKGPTGS